MRGKRALMSSCWLPLVGVAAIVVIGAGPLARAQEDVAPGGRGGGAQGGRGVVAPPARARGQGGANTADPANALADFTPKAPVRATVSDGRCRTEPQVRGGARKTVRPRR